MLRLCCVESLLANGNRSYGGNEYRVVLDAFGSANVGRRILALHQPSNHGSRACPPRPRGGPSMREQDFLKALRLSTSQSVEGIPLDFCHCLIEGEGSAIPRAGIGSVKIDFHNTRAAVLRPVASLLLESRHFLFLPRPRSSRTARWPPPPARCDHRCSETGGHRCRGLSQ